MVMCIVFRFLFFAHHTSHAVPRAGGGTMQSPAGIRQSPAGTRQSLRRDHAVPSGDHAVPGHVLAMQSAKRRAQRARCEAVGGSSSEREQSEERRERRLPSFDFRG